MSMKSIVLFTVLVLGCVAGFSQMPGTFKYQAVFRSSEGEIRANETFGLEISIVKGSDEGERVFFESHSVTTNSHGLFTIVIGADNKDAFNAIDWTQGPYFLKTTVNGTTLGVTELLSVPYALVANKAISAEKVDYSAITNKPNYSDTIRMHLRTLDVSYSKTEIDNLFTSKMDTVSLHTVALTGNYADLKGAKTKLSEFENDKGFLLQESDPLFATSPASKITDALVAWCDSASKITTVGYSKTEVDSLIAHLQLSDSLSLVARSGSYVDLLDAPTAVSAFANDNGYLTKEFDSLFIQSPAASITRSDIENWNSKPSTGNYDTLVLVTIDTVFFYDTLVALTVRKDTVYSFSKDTVYISENNNTDLSNYYTIAEVDDLVASKSGLEGLASVAVTGSYNDLTDVPAPIEVPSKISAFENDAQYSTTDTTLTEEEVDAMVSNNGYATKDMQGEKITNLAAPENANDAVNKEYVDLLQRQLQVLNQVLIDNGMYGTLTDIDKNIYRVIKINDKLWMADNLKVTRYADGTAIEYVDSAHVWDTLKNTDIAYTFYDTAGASYSLYDSITFGALYTWTAAMNGASTYDGVKGKIQGPCPQGWHIPTFSEWDLLVSYLNAEGYGYEGSGPDVGKSVASTAGWDASLSGGNVGNKQEENNTAKFDGLPSGEITSAGISQGIGQAANWWSSTQSDTINAYVFGIKSSSNLFTGNFKSKNSGQSIRCVKDVK